MICARSAQYLNLALFFCTDSVVWTAFKVCFENRRGSGANSLLVVIYSGKHTTIVKRFHSTCEDSSATPD